jgi:hypothetical protein
MKAVNEMSRLWDVSSDEDKQGLVRSLFEYIVYDLDKHRIVDFRLQPWADRFIKLRASLYPDGDGPEGKVVQADKGEGNEKYSGRDDAQVLNTEVPHRGLLTISLPLLEDADSCIAALIYLSETLSSEPISGRTPTKTERNAEIIHRYTNGETVPRLALIYNISETRIYQILQNE